jgi:tetratricopeptide (TPR) repeat protein
MQSPEFVSFAKTGRTMSKAEHEEIDQGNNDDALGAQQKALESLLKTVGKNHLSTALAHHNLGTIYEKQGNGVDALKHYRWAVEIQEAIPDDRSDNDIPIRVQVMEDTKDMPDLLKKERQKEMGELYETIGRLELSCFFQHEKAVEALEKAIPLMSACAGETKSDVARLYHQLAKVLESLGDFDGALESLHKVLTINHDLYGDSHPTVLANQEELADMLFAKGDFKGAEKEYRKTIEKRESQDLPQVQHLPDNNTRALVRLYRSMGHVLHKKKDEVRGDDYYHKAAQLTPYRPLFG